MTFLKAWWLFGKGYRIRLALSFASVCASIFILSIVLHVTEHLSDNILEIFESPDNQILLRERELSVGMFNLRNVLPSKRLTPEIVGSIVELDGIESVTQESWSRIPVHVSTSILGKTVGGDIVLMGVESKVFQQEIPDFQWEEGNSVPILIPQMLLTAYNAGFAKSNGLVQFTPDTAKGLSVNLLMGVNHFNRMDNTFQIDGKIVGVTNYGETLAAIIPKEVLDYYHTRLGVENPTDATGLLVTLESDTDVSKYESKFKRLGLSIVNPSESLEQIREVRKGFELGLHLILWVLSGCSVLVAYLIFANLLAERRADLRILHHCGNSASRIFMLAYFDVVVLLMIFGPLTFLMGTWMASLPYELLASWIGEHSGLDFPSYHWFVSEQASGFLFMILMIQMIFAGVQLGRVILSSQS